ncbi:SycD/LcrH family type III secretion system chaperone [Sansalvadorimonas verongulae]|uniref:SycD/LcrH family type III secretion system chaperone n=1 Tax=Sansalvadorimonas verongulae TaxID=2172824 RepID=UPI0012BCFFD6|nr:SycD/LcrH family type III secretion system chaperone [Sansalvadorimonas verongulae]MTI13647.1 CesD/SycD/LcrH family type III secretion system chaperone [Sansalvadorimonas verongulae]
MAKVESVLRNLLGALGGDHHLLGQLQDGVTIAKFKNIPDEVLESIYALGYSHFQSGNTQEAHDLFLYLSFHDHTNPRFLASFGACCLKMGKYEQAAQVLELAADMAPSDPGPALNLAHTFESMGDKDKARDALLAASARAEKQPQYQPIKQIADTMMERMAPALSPQAKGE